MDVGDGFWGTATGSAATSHCFSDPVVEQIGCMVTMHEGDHLLIMGMRLRVRARQNHGNRNDLLSPGRRRAERMIAGLDTSTPEPIWFHHGSAGRARFAAQLITTANMYFAGLENNDGKAVYPFADDCDRMENGIQTTNNPTLSPNAPFNAFAMSCMAQFKSGYYAVVTRIHHRRFPIVDQERGVVWANVIFDQNGTVLNDPPHQRPGRVDEEFQPPVESGGHRSVQDHGRQDSPDRDGGVGIAVPS